MTLGIIWRQKILFHLESPTWWLRTHFNCFTFIWHSRRYWIYDGIHIHYKTSQFYSQYLRQKIIKAKIQTKISLTLSDYEPNSQLSTFLTQFSINIERPQDPTIFPQSRSQISLLFSPPQFSVPLSPWTLYYYPQPSFSSSHGWIQEPLELGMVLPDALLAV